jgi:hypothetical protein
MSAGGLAKSAGTVFGDSLRKMAMRRVRCCSVGVMRRLFGIMGRGIELVLEESCTRSLCEA